MIIVPLPLHNVPEALPLVPAAGNHIAVDAAVFADELHHHGVGLVVGGGAALAEVYKVLKPTLKAENADVQKGIDAVLESLYSPLRQIASNAGYDPDEIQKKQEKAEKSHGFDAKEGKWVDLFAEGIVDPTQVTRSAVLNASSIASLFVTTEAAVSEIKEDKPAMPPMGGDMY